MTCTTCVVMLQQKMGIKKIEERTSSLWKLSEKEGTCKTCFDEDLAGQVFFLQTKQKSGKTCGEEGQRLPQMPRGYNKRKPKEQQRAIRRVAFWKILKSVHRPDCPPSVRCEEVEEECGQAKNIARETCSVPLEMTIFFEVTPKQ